MSRVIVEFKTDGAAFRRPDDGTLEVAEVAARLRDAAEMIEAGSTGRALIDSWGNTVGSFAVEEDR